MKDVFNKILTAGLLTFMVLDIFAASTILNQEKFNTHLRWSLAVPKDDIEISKKENVVLFKTLNDELFKKLSSDVKNIIINKNYIKNIDLISPSVDNNNVASVRIILSKEGTELFSFYRDKEQKYIIDFWKNADSIATSKAAISKKIAEPIKKISKKIPKLLPRKKIPKRVLKTTQKTIMKAAPYRDFRYGAPFIWDYKPIAPDFRKTVDIRNKTAEYFYPIENRPFDKNKIEAHLQLTINMYRKEKYGLMNKSIFLFEKKYRQVMHKYKDLHEYLKANSILRDNFKAKDPGPVKMAINMYRTIAKRTSNYEFSKAIYRYLINYYLTEVEHVQALRVSKQLFVLSMNAFDREEAIEVSKTILYCLSNLGQVDTISDFINEKTIKKLLPRQTTISYQIFTLVMLNDYEGALDLYKKIRKSLIAPVDLTIIYNIGEAYFRNSEYKKAIGYFDNFIDKYSYMSSSANARVRIALSYEILGRDNSKVSELYLNAINRSSLSEVSYEAKLRYVALRTIRKNNITEADFEARVFLDKSKYANHKFSKNIDKLLWLVRLRTFIVDKQYKDALSYLNAIPLKSLKPSEVRVFEADGAEVVYGIISEFYKKSKYSDIITIWEEYKKRYISKVAMDPYLNFVVGNSYLKLKLWKGFAKHLKVFKKIENTPEKTFPMWGIKKLFITPKEALVEMRLLHSFKLEKWSEVDTILKNLKLNKSSNNRLNYYQGMRYFQKKDYHKAIKSFEKFFANNTGVTESDSADIAEIVKSYTDSIYKIGDLDKFKNVARALLNDTSKMVSSSKYMVQVRERLAYLLLEIMVGEKNPKISLILESEIVKFKNMYKESEYSGRVDYLYGITLLDNQKEKEGLKVLNAILNDKNTSDYIKELVRSELTLIRIKERTI